MTLDYFYGQSGELFAYFRIPKALFQDSRFRQLSTDARTLYGILLDRMSLSAKNGWLDEQGRVYIIYTVREVQESLCCAEHKAVKLFRELEDMDLIERKRRGLALCARFEQFSVVLWIEARKERGAFLHKSKLFERRRIETDDDIGCPHFSGAH